ncbi:hypothetical protein [Prescottella equi]|uniref:hypothetical protein n=2 Tax=Rhodococcus hoagii TaxID=43767 RepID=UPI000A115B99|nr:hypothetical protein [Prescottella equi]ORM16023.1 hypothetical protein A5N74_19660 [Prescottella equi]
MARRHRSTRNRNTLAGLIDRLPDGFYEPTPTTEDGQMTGLHGYLHDLDGWLRREQRLASADDLRSKETPSPSAVEVMTEIGLSPARWYRVVLS